MLVASPGTFPQNTIDLIKTFAANGSTHSAVDPPCSGIGIPPEVKEKMFNPFFTTKPAGEGTGLGLSITHDIIVKQHTGSIEVETLPGEFTEVRVILPRTATFITDIRGRT